MSSEKDEHSTSADHQSNEQQMMSAKMRLNMEEVRILQECNRESFYYRSVPLAVAAMAATHLAVRRGFLKSHPRFGSSLKMIGACFVGWFVGKISYRSVCEEKFLHLQNSPLADLIRKKKGHTLETFTDASPGDEMTLHFDDAPSLSLDTDYVTSSRSLNLDTDKNIQYSGLDDSGRPTGSEYDIQPEDKIPKYSTTYEDLRRKNREEYELRQSKRFQPPLATPSPVPPPSSSPPRDWRNLENKPPTRQSSYQPETPGLQNVYGDRWDN